MTDQLNRSHPDTRDRLVEPPGRLFFEQGYEFTTLAQIRKLDRANSGSLHYFFPSKEDLLAAVLEKHKSMLGPQIVEPAYEEASDPIERIFAILNGYRKLLRATDFCRGCPIGNLALEVCNNHPKVRRLIAENFQVSCGTIEGLIKEASDRLPAKMKPASLARHVLAPMQGGVMLARLPRPGTVRSGRESAKRFFRQIAAGSRGVRIQTGGKRWQGQRKTYRRIGRSDVPKGVDGVLHQVYGHPEACYSRCAVTVRSSISETDRNEILLFASFEISEAWNSFPAASRLLYFLLARSSALDNDCMTEVAPLSGPVGSR